MTDEKARALRSGAALQRAAKLERRQNFRAQAAEHLHEEPTLSIQVSRTVLEFCKNAKLGSSSQNENQLLGCYQALPGEPDLRGIYSDLKAEGFALAFPTISGDDIHFFQADQPSDWQVGPFGIEEPHPERAKKVALNSISTVLVPGLAFDRRGGRIGRGKGFYDRALQNYKGTKVGVTFSYAVSKEELPCEAHDVRMDMIITEEGVNTCRERVL